MPRVTFHYDFKKETLGLNWKNQVVFIPDNLLEAIIKKSRRSAEFFYNHLISHPKKQLRQLIMVMGIFQTQDLVL